MASVDNLETRNAEIRSVLKDLDAAAAGEEFSPEDRQRWNELNDELDANEKTIAELNARAERLAALSQSDRNTETERTHGPHFQTRKPSAVPDDPTRLEEYRTRASSIDELEKAYVDGARKIVDDRFRTALPGVSREEAQDDVERLLTQVNDREVALRMIATSTPSYKREFTEYVKSQGRIIGPEMQRAASLTTTAGGFAVPVELDTTLLLTNAGASNPIRQIARVRQTNVNHVEFVNTVGVTAAYAGEASTASDNAPTLAQPVVDVEKAYAFVPMSIEIAEDWAAIQQDMAMAFADAKNRLEADKFLTGTGHTNHQPQGLIAAGGATQVVSSAATSAIAVGDLFSLENALGYRYRANASIIANKAAYQKVRQFASNGVNIWVQLQGALPPELIGYPAYEATGMSSGVTTSGSTVMTIGDFNYFAIVDRAGMNVEFIPHLFSSGNLPLGQRGLYAWWRNSSQVLAPVSDGVNSAFVSLKVT